MTDATPPTAPDQPSDAQPTGDFWERTFNEPKQAKGCCAGVAVIGLVLLTLMVARCNMKSDVEPEQRAPAAQSGPNEIDIVSECDLAVRDKLVSYSSYDPAYSWSFKVTGKEATVLRRFEATNGFGAKIAATYLCKWDDNSKSITSLETIDAMNNHQVLR